MAEKRHNLDDITMSTEHAEVMHPLRALMDHHFYIDGVINSEGGMWLVLIDALLFVPFMMAVFFYPIPSLLWLAVGLVASFVIFAGVGMWRKHRQLRT